MPRMMVALALGLIFALSVAPFHAQEKKSDSKGDPKSMDPKGQPGMSDPKKAPPKIDPKPVDPPKPVGLKEFKLSPNTVVVIVEELKEALQRFPGFVLVAQEKLLEMQERIAKLERQLKPDKEYPHACKLSGRLEGDLLILKADLVLATTQPRATVVLGFQGAQLADEGELDKQVPWLDVTEEGYIVKVEKEGTHQLTLTLKVPVLSRRSATAGASNERGFELGLPGAAVTTLNVELPAAVKELRYNDTLEKHRTQGRWDLALGKAKQLNLSWKEPLANPGNAPLLSAECQIQVRLEDTQAQIKADIFLEDLRSQTKEWQLQLPPQARVELKAPALLGVEILSPDGKNPWHTIKLPEPSAERLHLEVQSSLPRPMGAGRLTIGPFLVLKAFRQQGSISVQAAPEMLRGQRLVFHRLGETYQRDVAKMAAQADLVALFQYWNLGNGGKPNGKAPPGTPLEIELKTDKGKIETKVDHVVRLRHRPDGWLVETESRLTAKAAFAGTEYLDVQMPRGRLPGREWLTIPGVITSFPGAWPWWVPRGGNDAEAWPLEFFCEEEGGGPAPEIVYLDPQRRARIKLARPLGKDFTLKVTGRYWLPATARRAEVELPAPRGYLDRGGKSFLSVDDNLELLVGPPGAEEAVAKKHQYQGTWDQAPAVMHFSWQPHQPDFIVTTTADVTLQESSAHVRQRLECVVPTRPTRSGQPAGQVRLRIPPGVEQVKVISGGSLTQKGEVGLVIPQGDLPSKVDLVLEYRTMLAAAEVPADKMTSPAVPLIWPEGATKQTAKVRIWAPPHLWPTLDESKAWSGDWTARGAEKAPDHNSMPALVVSGSGAELPLRLRHSDADSGALAGWLCERGLIQVVVEEDGSHHYRARYLMRKVSATSIDVEFPVMVQPHVMVGKYKVTAAALDKQHSAIRIPLDSAPPGDPVVLELDYHLPPSFVEAKRFWQTTVYPPVFKGQFVPPRLRWQITWPTSGGVAFPLEKDLTVDFRWGWHGWLLGPEPAVTSADLESWLMGRETDASTPVGLALWRSGSDSTPVELALWRSGSEPLTLLHFPRQLWLLLCSGLFLSVALAVYVVPWPRWLWWLFMTGLVVGLMALLLFWPAWAPALFMGLQPGLLVTALLTVVHWLLKERYRRQLVFMPGFTRTKAGSSLVRGQNGNQVREASTVDSPPASQPKLTSPSELKTNPTP